MRCWCGYEPEGTTEAQRLERWTQAKRALDRSITDARVREEQDAWDAMAEHDDPKYVEILNKN